MPFFFRPSSLLLLAVIAVAVWPTGAAAQTFPFEQTLRVDGVPALEVLTDRGRIDVRVGEAGQVRVTGTVSVRIGWDVPADAEALAREAARQPPISQTATLIRLQLPASRRTREAVTVAYEVWVPPMTPVTASSGSGALAVAGVGGAVSMRTQSGAVELADLKGTLDVESGSGRVLMRGIRGDVRARTASSTIEARDLGGALHAQSGSGAIDASFRGTGRVEIETGSSAITLEGVQGALSVRSRSGRIRIGGRPTAAWDVRSGSSSLELRLDRPAHASLQATTGSGSITIPSGLVVGTIDKRRVAGTIGTGGPMLTLDSRSGSIRVSDASDPD